MLDVNSGTRKKVVFLPSSFLFIINPLRSQDMAPTHSPTYKPHKCPILINHILSIILPLTNLFFFFFWRHKGLETPQMPSTGFNSLTLSVNKGFRRLFLILICGDINKWIQKHFAVAKSLQSCPTLCDPVDGIPPGSPVPGILQARTLEWVAISCSNA